MAIIVTAGGVSLLSIVCAASSSCLFCSHSLSLGLCNGNTAELPLRVIWLSLMLRFVQGIGFSNWTLVTGEDRPTHKHPSSSSLSKIAKPRPSMLLHPRLFFIFPIQSILCPWIVPQIFLDCDSGAGVGCLCYVDGLIPGSSSPHSQVSLTKIHRTPNVC